MLGRTSVKVSRNAPCATLALLACLAQPAAAETISAALAKVYATNPDINQQRAGTRASDEGVATAKSGYRPQISANGAIGPGRNSGPLSFPRGFNAPASVGVNVTQNIFNGNMTANRVRQAESQVLSARESLRNTEQSELLNGATVYMNVLRDAAILELNRNNIVVSLAQLRETRLRQSINEVTLTDVAQAENNLASARAQYLTALANLKNSVASYRQVVGEVPANLEPARPLYALLPKTVDDGVVAAMRDNPIIAGAIHAADAAQLQVQLNEGQFYPTVNLVGSVNQNVTYVYTPSDYARSASLSAQLSVPLYSGGQISASVRQAKELLSQAELTVDLQRRAVQTGVINAYNQYTTARGLVLASKVAVQSAEIALNGVRLEASVGQRTTYDILVQQQTLLNARTSLISAQHDEVVGSYAVAASTGRLSAANLGLKVIEYDPTVHFEQIKDKWFGLRTPDGR